MVKKQWFSLAILAVIVGAYVLSKDGFAIPASWSKSIISILIACVFLLAGLTIKTPALLQSVKHWRAHIYIQGISFLLFPLVVTGVAMLSGLSGTANAAYLGFIVLACLPTTMTSCVVFTRNAVGNEECALFNAALGNILGILLTPALIYLIIGKSVQIDAAEVIWKLLSMIVAPFLAGHLCQHLLKPGTNLDMTKTASNWMILAVMLIAFLNAFQKGIALSVVDIINLLILSAALKIIFLLFVWYSSGRMSGSFTLADRKCLTITATQKSVAFGLPIIALLFSDNPDMVLITLPAIAYHTVQLFVDGIVASRLADI